MYNKSLKVLFFYNGIFVLGAGLLGPLYAFFVESQVDGVLAVSYSWAAFLIASTIATIIVGRNGDGVKEKEFLLMGGMLLRAIAWISFIFVTNIYQLILVQVIIGIGEAIGTPAFNTIFAEHLDKNIHMREYSTWTLIANLVSASGVLIGGYIVKYLGFHILFISMASLALISFFGLLLKPRKLL
ncbi:hypothetical protein C0584_00675 [Candidatus Parcubacteria bacterium]|nr:MAG: hypothetical protein C0584_00675 [Candidatus Parcubacteria bacterium]